MQADYYYYCFILREFFTPVLAGGLSLESEWQQVPSGLQYSYYYSCQSLQCCDLDSLKPFTDYQFLSCLFSKRLWTFQEHQQQLIYLLPSCSTFVLSSRVRSKYLSIFSLSCIFSQCFRRNIKIHENSSLFFLLINIRSGLLVNYHSVWTSDRD